MRLHEIMVTAKQRRAIYTGIRTKVGWFALRCVNAIGRRAIAIGCLKVDITAGRGISHRCRHIHVAAIAGLNHKVAAAADVLSLITIAMIVGACVGKLANRGQEKDQQQGFLE
ncbi:MAG: hypothetical protein ACI89D_002140 [Bermanella sp.]|jgi:hypothetical protein